MKVIKHELPGPIQILPLSDLHIGDAHCDIRLITDCIQRVLDTPGMYTILDGDLMNSAIQNSKSDIYGETIPPQMQLKRCIELFQPLADSGKILGILSGNHEERLYKTAGADMTEIFSMQLGLQDIYSATSALFFLKLAGSKKKKQIYTIYANHGNGGGGRRAGSKINALEELSRICIADVYLMGHTHQPATFRQSVIVPKNYNQTVTQQEQLFVNTASFLDWSGSYGDRGGYKPNSKHPPIITLEADRHHAGVIM